MSKLERGDVDPSRSFLWNLWHYRRCDHARVWSTCHSAMWRKIMMTHDIGLLLLILFVIVAFAAFLRR